MADASRLFRLYLNLHISLYRLTRGRLGGRLGPVRILLLKTTGCKSKQERTVPLGYFRDGENYVITGTNGGRPRHPGWYFNLRNSPHAEIQVGRHRIQVNAEQASPEDKERLWTTLIRVAPLYRRYREQPNRDIPMMILHPVH